MPEDYHVSHQSNKESIGAQSLPVESIIAQDVSKQPLVNPYKQPDPQYLLNTIEASSASSHQTNRRISFTPSQVQAQFANQSQLLDTDEMESEAIKANRRGKLCCCDKEAFVHKFTLFTLVADIIIFIGCLTMYCDILFGKNLVNGFDFIYRESAHLTRT